jgi:hypothetical protein
MIKQLINYIKTSIKKNFNWHDWVERLQAIVMGGIVMFTIHMGEPLLGIMLFCVATIDPKWFKEQ